MGYGNCRRNGVYTINIIEGEAMNQEVADDASSMAKSIKESGACLWNQVYCYSVLFRREKIPLICDHVFLWTVDSRWSPISEA